jgi:preprotein translocase subunit SecA
VSSALLRPGVAQGCYPQRQEPAGSWLDRSVYTLAGWLLRRAWSPPRRGQHIVRLAKQHARTLAVLNDHQLGESTRELRGRLHYAGLTDELVGQSFALIREVADRTLDLRHFDVQLLGGWAMLHGMVAEMETGEGKTLTATLPACTAALAGIPVHIITVNDYLVTRDAAWMQPLYNTLGLTVGTITEGMDPSARRTAYTCNITYCTNKQLVFDYLKDRLTLGNQASQLRLQLERLYDPQARLDRLLLRGLCFAIVDEADSVLIDEARTPLIISRESATGEQQRLYEQALELASRLQGGVDYAVLERERHIELTDQGKAHLQILTRPWGGVWTGARRRQELVCQALTARQLFIRDKHYLVRDGKVQIIDEFTGRVMADRSWERGLHQLIEAKEGCAITGQKDTLARISYQQFFRRYLRLAGMTGTAQEVAGELWSVYRLRVVTIPTNRPLRRTHRPDQIFRTTAEKWAVIVARIRELQRQGQPILVGTRSVAASEHLSRLLTEAGLPHQVLNARQDQAEADIIARAGEPGRITVATNMAGRGTDIRLLADVAERGGLQVIATERHEARRIDRQLFGRCGRQGDPGSFEAIVSLEDEIVTRYCPPFLRRLITGIGCTPWASGLIFTLAQHSAERHHAGMRRDLLKLDKQLGDMLAFSGRAE